MARVNQINEVPLGKLKRYEQNAKLHSDDQVRQIADSITEFGFLSPCLIDEDYNLIAGHGRLSAAELLGLETVPCVFVEGLTEAQRKAYILADNRLTELGEWDMDILSEELEALQEMDFDISLTGFDFDFGGEAEEVKIEEDNYDTDPEEVESRSKPGDIWKLGEHRLMCGDSTSITDLEKLLDGTAVDCVCTDPPYNMAYEGAGGTSQSQRKQNRIMNDNMSDAEFDQFMRDVYTTMYAGMKDGASAYVFYKELGKGVFLTALQESGLNFKQELIWVKNQIVLGGAKYQNKYEPCIFACKGKTIGAWYGERKQRSVIEDIDYMSEEELRTAVKELTELEPCDIIRERKQLVSPLHPTMKPIRLLAKLLANSTKEGDSVLDLFGGSGSTLIACEQMKRKCYMMELDTKYVDTIIDRWEQFTGLEAVRVK